MKLFVLQVGVAIVDVARIMPTEPELGRRYTGPLTAFLIQTDDGANILVDTGVSPEGAAARAVRTKPDDTLVVIRPEDDIRARLAAIGLTADDISHVIQSHFDFDHCGGNRYFPNATFTVQAEHVAYARQNPQRCPAGDWDRPELDYRLVDGDFELAPGIELVPTPGHAPGHQSVVVRGLRSGTVILTADATHTHREFEEERRGGSPADDEIIASIKKLKAIRDAEDATVITSHDMQAYREVYRLSPSWYE